MANQRRTKRFNMLMDRHEMRQLEDMAHAYRLTKSQLVRSLIRAQEEVLVGGPGARRLTKAQKRQIAATPELTSLDEIQ